MSDPTPDARPQHFVIQDPQERERGWHLTVEVSEADAEDLASGHVPSHVKASFRDLLEWAEQDRRRAERRIIGIDNHMIVCYDLSWRWGLWLTPRRSLWN